MTVPPDARKRLWLRNTLVMVGGYYLSSWVLIPFWIPVAKLMEKRVSHGGWESIAMRSFSDIPVLIGAALAGFLIGLCLETTRPLGWACGVGIFVATCNWSATTWHIKPSFSDLALQGASAAASGALAFVASWMTERRRTSRRATEGPA